MAQQSVCTDVSCDLLLKRPTAKLYDKETKLVDGNVMDTSVLPYITSKNQSKSVHSIAHQMKRSRTVLKYNTFALIFPSPIFPRFPGSLNFVGPYSIPRPLMSFADTFFSDDVKPGDSSTRFSEGTKRAKNASFIASNF